MKPVRVLKIVPLALLFLLIRPDKIVAQNELRDFATSKLGISNSVVSGAEVVGSLFKMHSSNVNYTNQLSQITNVQVNIKDPDELVRFYQSKIDEIKRESEKQKERKRQEIDALAKKLADEIADLAKKANISTGNALLDMGVKLAAEKGGAAIAKANMEKRIAEEEAKAKAELDKFMKREMEKIKTDVLTDNTNAKEEYLKAAAECFTESDEKRYFDHLVYHDCIIEEINKNYTWQNADWIKTNCSAPPRTYGFSAFTKTDNDFMAAAKRKYKIYTEKYNHPAFLDAAKKYTEAALAENRNNPDAYAFLSFMTEDIIEKYMYINFANYLMPSNQEIVKEKKIVKFYFTKEFFKAIADNNVEFISRSIQQKFHYDITDKNNNSPVAAAIIADREEISGMLLSGAGQNVLKDCFHFAIQKNAEKTIDKFISLGYKMTPDEETANGAPILYFAALNSSDKAGKNLVKNGVNLEKNLTYAKSAGNTDVLRKICIYSMDNAVENSGKQTVEKVMEYYPEIYKEKGTEGRSYLELAIEKNQKEIFQLFIARGVNFNSPEINSQALLEKAVSNKANDIVLVMLEMGINTNFTATGGGNILTYALGMGNLEIAPHFIEKKVSVKESDNYGKTPLYFAVNAANYKTTEMLLINGADVNCSVPEGSSILHIALKNNLTDIIDLVLSLPVMVDKTDKNGNTPLMFALLANDLGNAQKILVKKPNPNIANNKKWTALHYCAWKGYLDFTKKLITAGANINAKGEYGWTPLHYAARENKIEMALLLMENKADRNITDEWKRAPLKIAKERQFVEMKKILKLGKKV